MKSIPTPRPVAPASDTAAPTSDHMPMAAVEQQILRAVLDGFPDPVAVADLDGHLRAFNERAAKLLSVACPGALEPGAHLDTLLGDLSAFDELEVRAEPLHLGGTVYQLHVMRDMSAQRRLVRELKRARTELQTVLDNFQGLIYYKDTRNRLLRVNRMAANELGLEPDDIAGRHAREVFGEMADVYFESDLEVMRSGRPKLGFLVPVDGKSGRKWVEVNKVPIRIGANNEVSRILVVCTDVTARKLAEDEREELITELERSNAELERFTYTISHDLKTPLVTINGFLGMLEHDLGENVPVDVLRDLEHIRKATRTMDQLLAELLELSRVGRTESAPEVFALGMAIEEAVELVNAALRERGVSVELAAHLPDVKGHQTRLRELFQNLLDNAVKFMGDQPRPRIKIDVRYEPDGTAICRVRDNGIGIEPRYRNKVFGLFERLDASVDGTGVGLALVRRIVEQHGQRIWVEAPEDGQGSVFCFTLPLASG